MTTTTSRTMRIAPAAAGARASLAALLALVVTFAPERTARVVSAEQTARFGLLALGVFLVLQAVLLLALAPRLGRTRTGRALLVARGVVSLGGGLLALARPDGGIALLRPIEIVVFLVVGGLEVVGGLLRAEAPDAAGDAIVVGGLQVLVGLMVVILNPDALFSVGVLGAWAALVAVYLGIAAVTLRGRRRAAP